MEEKSICFKVSFKPTLGWADQTYLGNMLTELLGLVANKTTAFEFKIETLQEQQGNNSKLEE